MEAVRGQKPSSDLDKKALMRDCLEESFFLKYKLLQKLSQPIMSLGRPEAQDILPEINDSGPIYIKDQGLLKLVLKILVVLDRLISE